MRVMRKTWVLMASPGGRARFRGVDVVYPQGKSEFPVGRGCFTEAMQKSKIEWLSVGFG